MHCKQANCVLATAQLVAKHSKENTMIPVIVQTLMRNMRKNARLPMPTINDAPQRKDRSGYILTVFGLLVIIALILM